MSPGRTPVTLVGVRGFEPLPPCLQSRLKATLNAFAGVAYRENRQNSRSLNVPKLSRKLDHISCRFRSHVPITLESLTISWPSSFTLSATRTWAERVNAGVDAKHFQASAGGKRRGLT
jgi:hypothetical protein